MDYKQTDSLAPPTADIKFVFLRWFHGPFPYVTWKGIVRAINDRSSLGSCWALRWPTPSIATRTTLCIPVPKLIFSAPGSSRVHRLIFYLLPIKSYGFFYDWKTVCSVNSVTRFNCTFQIMQKFTCNLDIMYRHHEKKIYIYVYFKNEKHIWKFCR